MSFIYPRTIKITRPVVLSGIGAQSYQGLNPVNETLIAQNIAASIQASGGSKLLTNLPADMKSANVWNIFFKLDKTFVRDRDIITDDAGIRYQVSAAYWNSLGFKCICERLEV